MWKGLQLSRVFRILMNTVYNHFRINSWNESQSLPEHNQNVRNLATAESNRTKNVPSAQHMNSLLTGWEQMVASADQRSHVVTVLWANRRLNPVSKLIRTVATSFIQLFSFLWFLDVEKLKLHHGRLNTTGKYAALIRTQTQAQDIGAVTGEHLHTIMTSAMH